MPNVVQTQGLAYTAKKLLAC